MQQRQLYAEIRRTSEYSDQASAGELFPVILANGPTWDYIVIGGPGGQYRVDDVYLYVQHDGKAKRL